MSILIKRLSGKELGIAQTAIALFLDDGEVATQEATLRELLATPAFYFIVALHNDQVVGRLIAYEFLLFKNNTREVYLYEVDVVDEHKQQGVGTSLIEFTKVLCKERGVSAMFVGTEADNDAAQKLYLKTGAKLVGNMPHFVFDL